MFISFWKWLGETNPRSLSFFTRILAFAVLALSGEGKTSGKVLKNFSYVLAMSRFPGISKKKGREKCKKSRQEVSCSWASGRYRSARTHIHTSFTTLRTTPPVQPQTPKGVATPRNVIKQAKEGRLLQVVGCKVSHVTWRWDLAGVNIERVHVWDSHCLGEDTCSILWTCPLTTSDGVSVLGKWVWSSAEIAGYAGCQSWLYFS